MDGIYLSKEIREQYGDTFRIAPYRGELKLIPIPDDPVDDLRDRTETPRKTDKSTEELEKQARDHLEEKASDWYADTDFIFSTIKEDD
ncbi:MAG: AbrB/MazE/SpoVT family DNA-binding domain-containing protein [Candidatus Nanohaloarchaeota archaeon QJJ-5]|nr:AbrB/MazE/SpoVT family DNA-binding domain-containing protein [Candidatus Nanohaloarchaeota archaeon QJJ-5]